MTKPSKITLAAGFAAALIASVSTSGTAQAADLGGNCCADLEERIAELEATTARKGNRKVSLTVYGVVHQSILFWDDGDESNAYIGTNAGYPTFFGFTGDAQIAPGWKAGYKLELWVGDNYSYGYNQVSDEAFSTPVVWQSHWYIESEKYGRLTMGQASRVSDLAPEQDLSRTTDASYSLVSDIGFAFLLRRADGALTGLTQGSVSGYNLTGETAPVVRYDSPAFAGFTFAASFGEDDMTDFGVFYSHDGSMFTVAAAFAYAHSTDENGLVGFVEFPGPAGNPFRFEADTYVGSVSVLHKQTGLNATIAAGTRQFDGVADFDAVPVNLADASFIWAKLGWIKKLNHLGDTAFYGEYGYYEDGVSAGWDLGTIATLSADGASGCAAAGVACQISGSQSEVWGVGVVQHIDAAEMAVYVGYRHWSTDIDLEDVGGAPVAASSFEDFQHVIAGARISF